MKKFHSIFTFVVLFTTNLFSQDLAIQFIGPVSGGCLTTSETISVIIINMQSSPFAGSWTASYSIDGGTFVTENVGPMVMGGNSTYNYTFLAPGDFSGCETHDLVVAVNTPGDVNSPNDTLTVTVTSDCPLMFTALDADPTLSGTDGVVSCRVTGGTPTYTYLWTNMTTLATSNSNPWTGLSPAVYAINVTDANGCSTDSTVEVVMAYLSLESGLIDETIVNFSTNFLTIQMAHQTQATCFICDVSGKQIQTINITDIKTQVEFNQPSAVYFYQIVDQNFTLISNGKFAVN